MRAVLIGLFCASIASCSDAPPAASGLSAQKEAALLATPAPSFEPFEASRMFLLIDPLRDESPVTVPTAHAALENILAEIEEQERDFAAGSPGSAPSSYTQSVVEVGILYNFLPTILMALESLWDVEQWNAPERELADLAVQYCQKIDARLMLDFGEQTQPRPDLELRRLARWYWSLVADPEVYGQMIFTMDDGPHMASKLELAEAEELQRQSQQRVTESFSIELGMHPEHGWCMRGLVLGEPAWMVQLDEVPRKDFGFVGQPTDLGPFGWKVNASFGEYTHLYLSKDYEFLFYFTSW